MTTSSLRSSFAVRAGCRTYENRGKVCPSCGQADPLLLLKDGRCVNCTSRHREEKHHILGKAFRRGELGEVAEAMMLAVSPNAHRLLSDLQVEHPTPAGDDTGPDSFLKSWMLEFLAGLVDLWLALTYLNEQPEVLKDIPPMMLFPLAALIFMERPDLRVLILVGGLLLLLLLAKPDHLDLSKVCAYAK